MSQSVRKLNRLLIQHYTTVLYLNLLAGLKRKKSNEKYEYWLGELESWYEYLLKDRAKSTLNKNKPLTIIPASLKQWIAKNLMNGIDSSVLYPALRKQGFSDIEIATEILAAENHPYIEAGQQVVKTLKKREWLINTCDALARLDDRYESSVEKRKVMSFKKFVKDYYSKHLPVVLTNAVDDWPALKTWTPDYFAACYEY